MTGIRSRMIPVAVGALLLTTGLFGLQPTIAHEDVAHPAHIHSGTCDAIGEVVAPLSDVGADFMMDGTPMAGEMVGSAAAMPMEASNTIVQLALGDILAADHAIVVHASADDMGTYIACGNIGGTMLGEAGMVVGLAPLNDSGYSGTAWLADNGDGTTNVALLLTSQEGMMGGMSGMSDMAPDAVLHPSHIHSGTCDAIGEVVAPLSDVGADFMMDGTPMAGEMGGSMAATPVELGDTTVELALGDIVAADHAIVVHASADDMGTYIACGNIGGMMLGTDMLIIGLAPLNDSGHSGSVWLTDNGDGTTGVSVALMSHGGMMGGTPAADAASDEVAVAIKDFAYDPATLEIAAGTTVTWTNMDTAPHTATATDKSFQSDKLDKGQSYSFTFDTPGTFDYFCEYHANMSETIVVS